jgi:NADH-quinone oxidoreductase subunit H
MTYAAILVWFERRMLAWWQDRYGPNRVGPFGIGLALADIIKLLAKEDWVPPFADRKVFVIAPCFVMIAMLMGFAVVPYGPETYIADLNVGLLFFMAMSSMAVYAVLLGGLSSNNKFSLIGGLRSASQMVSYEVFMGLSLMGVVMLAGSFSMVDIVESQKDGWYIISQFFGFLVFMVAGIAESHRLPFDLPEAEQELVAGFHTEYSGMKFGIFMVGEYLGVILVSAMIATIFFGGWIGPDFLPPIFWLAAKTFFFVMFFILLRASMPRPRYDQLMSLGWKVMLPITLVNLVVTGGVALWMSS